MPTQTQRADTHREGGREGERGDDRDREGLCDKEQKKKKRCSDLCGLKREGPGALVVGRVSECGARQPKRKELVVRNCSVKDGGKAECTASNWAI